MAHMPMVSLDEEMKRNPDLKKADIESLREWHKKQPHLPEISDSELVLFLHSNYYRVEPTKATLDTYYSVKTHVPEFFADRDPANKELQQAFKIATYFPLEQSTVEGYKVLFGKLMDLDSTHYVFPDSTKYMLMVVDQWLCTQGTMNGHIMLIDTKGVTLGHAAKLNPMALKKFLYFLQEGMPVRLKGLHFLNTTAVMDTILNMMKPFMKKELLNILYFHKTVDSVNKYVPVEALPNELGGKGGCLKDLHEAELKRLEKHREWFLEEEKVARVDETKRPGKGKTVTDIFGVEGNFKKLEID